MKPQEEGSFREIDVLYPSSKKEAGRIYFCEAGWKQQRLGIVREGKVQGRLGFPPPQEGLWRRMLGGAGL